VKNLKIGLRLCLGFGIILVLLLLVGGYSIYEINALNSEVDLLVNDRMETTERANKIIVYVNNIDRSLRDIIDGSKDQQIKEIRKIVETRKALGDVFEHLINTVKTGKGVAILKKATDLRSVYIRHTDAYLELIKTEQIELAKKSLYSEIRDAEEDYMAAVEELIDFQTELAETGGKNAAEEARSATMHIGILLSVAMVLSISLAFFIIRSIIVPINKASALADTMAKGIFTTKLDIKQKDEIGLMAKSLNAMVEQLGLMIKEIIGGTNRLASSSNDLATISRTLSSAARNTADKSGTVAAAAEEMNANVQSISVAIEQSSNNVNMVSISTEEMTATINEISLNAEKARSISEGAVKQSRLTSEMMATLGESAKKIGRVTETITEISEQTNLLALNATIEAARAGEAGKGFAVVANEIKELARQTAEATVDIKNQIDEMQITTTTTVEDMEKISAVITEINKVIGGIATSVEEQSGTSSEISNNISQASRGIAEVNQSVAQNTVAITDITRDIADIYQQSKQVGIGSDQVQASAQGLTKLAANLEDMVKKFRV
jgi:methyl-accepting chemotaxis protein